jgi:thiol-disulfide isomerase/thioredoxin
MRKILAILALIACFSCVGQKEDPDYVYPEDGTDPEPGGQAEGSRFFHRVLALEFTATWCQYCPNMAAALEEARKERPGRIQEIAVHYSDEMSSVTSDGVVSRYKVSAFPTAILDLDPSTRFTKQDKAIFMDYVDRTAELDACGLALESSFKDGLLSLSVKLKAAAEGEYSVGAALVEDGIVADQTGAGPGYVNNAVLRAFLGDGGLDGTPAGKLKKDEESTVMFSRAFDGPEARTRLVVFAIKDGTVSNTSVCTLNDNKAYEYEADD